jgi:flagellar biosynthesis protein FlhF
MPATLPAAAPGQRYKFVVKSAEEAASVIRERLGEEARVISVRQVEGEGLARFLKAPKLEVIAEIPSPEPRQAVPPPAPAPIVPPVNLLKREESAPRRVWDVLERAGLRREFLARVEHRPEWRGLDAMPLHAALSRAAMLLKEAAPGSRRVLTTRAAFFGTPGAGATTALCKQLATDVFLRGRAACVMKLDGDDPNSTEGLAMFCEALGVPLLRSVSELGGLDAATAVYFDAPGAARDGRVGRLLEELAIDSRVLVVNAAYDRELIQQAYTRAEALGGTHVVFTHLDELNRCGKLWEFALDGALSPLFGSSGPNLAGDCEPDVLDLLVRRTLSAAGV